MAFTPSFIPTSTTQMLDMELSPNKGSDETPKDSDDELARGLSMEATRDFREYASTKWTKVKKQRSHHLVLWSRNHGYSILAWKDRSYYQSMGSEFRHGNEKVLGTQPHPTRGSTSSYCVLHLNLIKGMFNIVSYTHTHTHKYASNNQHGIKRPITLTYIYHASHIITNPYIHLSWHLIKPSINLSWHLITLHPWQEHVYIKVET